MTELLLICQVAGDLQERHGGCDLAFVHHSGFSGPGDNVSDVMISQLVRQREGEQTACHM